MDATVLKLIEDGYLKTPSLIAAFQRIRREDFLPADQREDALENIPLPIGYGQTISQPLTVAIMFEMLQPKKGDRVLDIGAGSGWTAALFGALVGTKGGVIALERIPQLRAFAEANIRKYHMPQVEVRLADGTRGAADDAPFTLIHIAAAADDVPQLLLRQLAVGGRLIVPVGVQVQTMYLITRTSRNGFEEHRQPGFTFVPLIPGPIA